MKIGIIAFSNIKYLPYISKYTNYLNSENICYNILYWDRENLGEKFPENYICYKASSKLKKNKLLKVRDFFGFKKFVVNNIEREKYDLLIILSTLPAILLGSYLKKEYKNKYIVDVRDPSYENIFFYKKYLEKVFKNSHSIVISSRGFKNFLPQKFNYYNVHNMQQYIFDKKNEKKVDNGIRNKIRISFIGFVRHFEVNKKLIDSLGNDSRFIVNYYGYLDGSDALKIQNYVKNKKVNNIFFYGPYTKEEKERILHNTDILHNLYNNNKTKYSLGNKLYDSALYKIPQLVSKNSFMSEMVDDFGLGLSIDIEETNLNWNDQIYHWYQNFDFIEFEEKADIFLKHIENDELEFFNMLSEFISIS